MPPHQAAFPKAFKTPLTMTYATATELLTRFDAAEIAQRVDRGVPRLVTAELTSVSAGAHATRQAEALVYSNRAWHALGPVVDAAAAPVLLWPDDSATF